MATDSPANAPMLATAICAEGVIGSWSAWTAVIGLYSWLVCPRARQASGVQVWPTVADTADRSLGEPMLVRRTVVLGLSYVRLAAGSVWCLRGAVRA